jgi:hypothetical protein
LPRPLFKLRLIHRQARAIGLCLGAAGPNAMLETSSGFGRPAAVSLEIGGFNDAPGKAPDHYRNHTVAESMSLMPSESASFPDLVGWHHGYLPPHLGRPCRRRQQKQLTTQLLSPVRATSADENRATVQSDNGCDRSPVLTGLRERVELEQDTPPDRAVSELVIPTIGSAAAEALRPLEAATGTPAAGESRERPGGEKTIGADYSRPPRVALPVLPQRSPTEMRAKIQAQVARTEPTMRPRTPARGMTIAHQFPIGTEKPTSTSSRNVPMRTVPRRHLVNLRDFMSYETIAVGILMLSMGLGFSKQLEDSPLSSLLKVVAVAAAIAVMTGPVILLWLGRRIAAKRS